MGWSCRNEVAETMERWRKYCADLTGTSNTFLVGSTQYFWELDATEYDNGAATGAVYRMGKSGMAYPVGTFTIKPDGTLLSRCPINTIDCLPRSV